MGVPVKLRKVHVISRFALYPGFVLEWETNRLIWCGKLHAPVVTRPRLNIAWRPIVSAFFFPIMIWREMPYFLTRAKTQFRNRALCSGSAGSKRSSMSQSCIPGPCDYAGSPNRAGFFVFVCGNRHKNTTTIVDDTNARKKQIKQKRCHGTSLSLARTFARMFCR